MNPNDPYAPPPPAPPYYGAPTGGAPYGGGPPQGGPPLGPPADREWTVRDVLSASWARFNQTGMGLVPAYLLMMGASQLAQIPAWAGLTPLEHASSEGDIRRGFLWPLVGFAISLPITMAISMFLQVGMIRMVLQVARGEPLRFGVLLSGMDRVLPLVGVSLVMMPAILLGFLIFVVPGVILAIGWSLAMFYVVDGNLGPLEALDASWQATKDARGKLAGLFLASFGISFLGLMSCCVGLVFAVPFTMVVQATAYLWLSGAARSPNDASIDGWSRGAP